MITLQVRGHRKQDKETNVTSVWLGWAGWTVSLLSLYPGMYGMSKPFLSPSSQLQPFYTDGRNLMRPSGVVLKKEGERTSQRNKISSLSCKRCMRKFVLTVSFVDIMGYHLAHHLCLSFFL